MRVRQDGQLVGDAGRQVDRPHMVEEDEGADHPPPGEGQDAPDFEATRPEAAAASVDHELDHGSSGGCETPPAAGYQNGPSTTTKPAAPATTSARITASITWQPRAGRPRPRGPSPSGSALSRRVRPHVATSARTSAV